MSVGFELSGARRIAAAVQRVERQVRNLAGQLTRVINRPETTIRAKLDGSLPKDGKATATTYRFDPDAESWTLTTRTVTIREPGFLATGETYASDADVSAKFYQQAYWVDDASCGSIS